LRNRCCVVVLALGVAACAGVDQSIEPPVFAPATSSRDELRALPPPQEQVIVAVYGFADETGQHKPNTQFAEYSRAVTQGGYAFLVQALQEAGRRSWFRVVERRNLNNLLQERRIIDTTREQFLGPEGQPLGPIRPLLYAGVIVEGAIVAYESNTFTGGFGARYLGIGGSTEYRRDQVTVVVSLVSVLTGEVLTSVTATKSIFSVGIQGGAFRFVSFDELLEIEAGVTSNEPAQLAVRKAVEKAVYGMVAEGAIARVWQFADPAAGARVIASYRQEIGDGVALVAADPPPPDLVEPGDVPIPGAPREPEVLERMPPAPRREDPALRLPLPTPTPEGRALQGLRGSLEADAPPGRALG